MRSSGMTFTDGNSIDKETELCGRAVDCLRDLADRYYEAAEKAESESIKNELTSVSVRLKDTEPWRSHSFTLKKAATVGTFHANVLLERTVLP